MRVSSSQAKLFCMHFVSPLHHRTPCQRSPRMLSCPMAVAPTPGHSSPSSASHCLAPGCAALAMSLSVHCHPTTFG